MFFEKKQISPQLLNIVKLASLSCKGNLKLKGLPGSLAIDNPQSNFPDLVHFKTKHKTKHRKAAGDKYKQEGGKEGGRREWRRVGGRGQKYLKKIPGSEVECPLARLVFNCDNN